jgi:ketosteroid isomerase-like protein
MSHQNVDRLRAMYSSWAEGNFRAAGELLAEDVIFEPMADGRKAYRGREAVAEQTLEFLAQWSDFRIEAQAFEELGETVLVTERQHGKGKSSGIELEMTFYAAWTFRDGLVTRVRWDSDRTRALEIAPRT